jgi:hypothetical protein
MDVRTRGVTKKKRTWRDQRLHINQLLSDVREMVKSTEQVEYRTDAGVGSPPRKARRTVRDLFETSEGRVSTSDE